MIKLIEYAWKLLKVKLGRFLLMVICLAISLTMVLVAYNVGNQVEDGLTSKTYYDTVIGHSGSSSQLVMNALYFSENPLSTIDYEYYEELKKNKRVVEAVPMGMGDSYKGAKLIGTNTDYFKQYEVSKGTLFSDVNEVVLGSNIAKNNNLELGSEIHTTHGVSEGGTEHKEGYKVVGILKETGTAVDNALFCDIRSIWHAHNHEEESEEEHSHEEESEEHNHEGGVTAILLRCKSLSDQMLLTQEITKDTNLQAVSPTVVLREVLNNVDMTKKIVAILCGVIMLFGMIILYVLACLNLYDAKRDMNLMQLIGISAVKIKLLYLIQNVIIGVIAGILGVVGKVGIMLGVAGICESKGILLDIFKIYPLEFLIIGIFLIITIMPTIAYKSIDSKK